MSLKTRVQNALSKFYETPESVGYHFRLNLASIITDYLGDKDWTQKQLADAAGMKESQVSRIVHAESNCTFDTAGRVLFALGLRAGDVELTKKPDDRAQLSHTKVFISFDAGVPDAGQDRITTRQEEPLVFNRGDDRICFRANATKVEPQLAVDVG